MTDALLFSKVIGSLLLVCGLLSAVLIIIKKVNPHYFKSNTLVNSKLQIDEQIILSPKQRLLVVKYEDKKYILLLGNTELLIDKIEKSL